MEQTINSEWVSTAEAALILGVSAPLVRALAEQGIIDGDSHIVSRRSLAALEGHLDETFGTRTQTIVSLLEK